MTIIIAERLKPYSHVPGTRCVLPYTTLSFEIYPTLIRVYDLQKGDVLKEEHTLPISGPVKDFTVQLDLEKARIRVWGFDQSGYFRYEILPCQHGWKLVVDKAENGIQEIKGSFEALSVKNPTERLSLGNHKAQDWNLVTRRQDLTEILPVWQRAGQFVPLKNTVVNKNSLLDECLSQGSEALKALFLAGFEGILSPTHADKLFQGYSKSPLSKNESPLLSLSLGSQLIRRLFIEEDEQVKVLKNLPSEFHHGRFLGISLSNGVFIDLEWTKKIVRRMIIYGKGEISLQFQNDIKRYRIRRSNKDQGKIIKDLDHVLKIENGEKVLLDKFEK